LKRIMGITDPWLKERLFTFPTFGRYDASIDRVISRYQLKGYFDTFCDFVALQPDNVGRRWYIRFHELRKSFLIVFFWTGRFSTLDAARWMAGHSDADHIYAYIQANFPGDELPGLEAEYASKLLRDYADTDEPGEYENIEDLHREVCAHFAVADVSWIDENILQSWLEQQFKKGEFRIVPYLVQAPGGGTATVIAVRVKAK
jgi:hypothetical protein